MQHVGGDFSAQQVHLALGRVVFEAGAESPAQRQDQEVDPEDGQPEQKLADVSGRNRLVDDDADEERHTELAGLVYPAEEEGKEDRTLVAAIAPDQQLPRS